MMGVRLHPGRILEDEFMVPLKITSAALARALDLPQSVIEELVLGDIDITPSLALSFAQYFGTTAGFWMNLQVDYGKNPGVV